MYHTLKFKPQGVYKLLCLFDGTRLVKLIYTKGNEDRRKWS